MDLAKMNRVLEIFWWSMAAVTLIIVFIMTFIDGFDKWAVYYLVPVICVLVAFIRRFAAKKLAKSQVQRDANKK